MKNNSRFLIVIVMLFILSACDGSKIMKIEITQLPSKLTYIIGQDTQLDLSGGLIVLTRKDDKTIQLDMEGIDQAGHAEFLVEETIDFNTLGTYTVKLSKSESLSVSFDVTVIPVPYVDDNPILIGLYDESSRKFLVETNGRFVKNVDLGVYCAVGTHSTTLSGGDYQTVWKSYWANYTNIADYKIGYYVKFKITSGETLEKMILGPNDNPDLMWPYLRIYLYDDIHHPLHTWYSHLLEKEVNADTIITSIKLTGNNKTSEIDGAISLTTFTYNGPEDFDPVTGYYRGLSSHTITITRQ